MSKVTFLDVLDKAHTGPVVAKREWELKILFPKIMEKLREHGLEKTYDQKNPVNTDDGLADEFWKAGYELALDTGMFCIDTDRIIKFTEEELDSVMKEAPSEFSIGLGKNRVTLRSRYPEDQKVPLAIGSPLGMEVSEELYIPLMQSILQYRVIDIFAGGVPSTLFGRQPRSGSPYETLLGAYEAALVKEAMRRADRVGMPVHAVESSPTVFGQLGGFGIPGGFDPACSVAIPLVVTPLITGFSLLHKVAQALNCGAAIKPGYHSMIAGYSGPPEGAAIEAVAASVLEAAVHMATYVDYTVIDLRHLGSTGRETIWAGSVARQAQTRNNHMMSVGINSNVSGPCTDMLLYEIADYAIMDAVSGSCAVWGTRPTGCKYPNYGSGLENKFCAEVGKAAAGMKRSDANEIVKKFLPKYEDKLRYPPKGKSFTECTDLKTLKPTKEWQEIYDGVWKELEDLGLKNKY